MNPVVPISLEIPVEHAFLLDFEKKGFSQIFAPPKCTEVEAQIRFEAAIDKMHAGRAGGGHARVFVPKIWYSIGRSVFGQNCTNPGGLCDTSYLAHGRAL